MNSPVSNFGPVGTAGAGKSFLGLRDGRRHYRDSAFGDDAAECPVLHRIEAYAAVLRQNDIFIEDRAADPAVSSDHDARHQNRFVDLAITIDPDKRREHAAAD